MAQGSKKKNVTEMTDRELAEATATHTRRAADMLTFLLVLVVVGVLLSVCSALLNL